VVRLLKPGDIAGLELLVDSSYHHSAMTTHKSDVCRIPVRTILELETRYPVLYKNLMLRWQASLDEADRFITLFSTGTSQVRMARLLFEMQKAENLAWGSHLNREDMGDILGISTETASRIIAEFKRRGLISETRNELAFNDPDALESISRDEK
jgi:CRP-like cAMP-binding protein